VYSSYQSRSITLAAADAGYATGILTSGRKARVILYLSAYSGTNTAASSVSFGVSGVNEENSPGNQWNYAAAGANPYYPSMIPAASIQNFTQQNPDIMLPVHSKQNLLQNVIPPEHVFQMACAGTNLDGTVVVNIITAEIGE
jgi:hypothetical protein